jgi:predicted NBD/HSP70 family sugar kinase
MAIFNETQIKILREVWLKEKTTMLDISNILKIDRSSISRNLKDLKKSGLVYYLNEQQLKKSVGRSPFILKFNYTIAYNIGITVTENFILALLMDLSFKTLQKKIFYKKITEKSIIDDLMETINFFSNYLNKVLFISISFPEPVDDEKGLVISSGIFPIKDLYLKNIIEELIKINVHLENDANAGAIYHYYKNNGIYKYINFMFLSFNITSHKVESIQGNGIIFNGTIYKGANHFAGELPIIIPLISQSKDKFIDIRNFKEFLRNEENSQMLEQYVENYSNIASLIINFLDPELFIFGGYTELLPEIVLKSLINRTKERIIDEPRRKIKVEVDKGGLDNIAKGSAMAFMNKILSDFELASTVFSKVIV